MSRAQVASFRAPQNSGGSATLVFESFSLDLDSYVLWATGSWEGGFGDPPDTVTDTIDGTPSGKTWQVFYFGATRESWIAYCYDHPGGDNIVITALVDNGGSRNYREGYGGALQGQAGEPDPRTLAPVTQTHATAGALSFSFTRSGDGTLVAAVTSVASLPGFDPTDPAVQVDTLSTPTNYGGAMMQAVSGASPQVIACTGGQSGYLMNGIALAFNDPPSGDTTAPVLTSPTGTATGSTTATVGATTDEGNGTLYAVVTTSATLPSVAQIKAGQNDGGTSAAWAGSVAVSSTGAKSLNATGLTASTTYYAHLVHADAAANDSNRVSSASFTTSAPNTPPTFPGPNISNMTAKRGQNIGTLDVSGLFDDTDALTFSAVGSWPAGVTINSAGVITRAPSAVPAVYSGLQVRATDTAAQTQDSNAFSFTVQQCLIDLEAANRFLGAAVGAEITDGFAREAAEDYDVSVYLGSQWPLTSPLHTVSGETTDADGFIPALGDDDLLFGTVYWVLGRRASDSEPFITRIAAS